MIAPLALTLLLALPGAYSNESARADIASGGFDTVIENIAREGVLKGDEERKQLLLHALRMRSISAFNAAKYQTALGDLQRIMELDPADTRPRLEIAIVYTKLAGEFLDRFDTPSAVAALRKARQYDPGRRDVLRALAKISLQEGRAREAAGKPLEAIGYYRNALEIDSANIEADLLIGQLYYSREEFALAKLHLEHARDLATSRIQGLDELLAKVTREFEASRGYATVEADGFLVRFEGAQRYDLFYQIQPHLVNARDRASRIFERKAQHPLSVIIYAEGDFSHAVSAPDWAGGVFDGKIRIRDVQLRATPDVLEKTLRHEVAHAVLEDVAPGRIPGWVHEGIAKYMEGNAWDAPADATYLLTAIRAGRRVRLAELSGTFADYPKGADVRLAYAEASAAIRYLVAIYGEPVLADLVTLLATGRSIEEAVDSITFYDLDTFQTRIDEWVVWEYGR